MKGRRLLFDASELIVEFCILGAWRHQMPGKGCLQWDVDCAGRPLDCVATWAWKGQPFLSSFSLNRSLLFLDWSKAEDERKTAATAFHQWSFVLE